MCKIDCSSITDCTACKPTDTGIACMACGNSKVPSTTGSSCEASKASCDPTKGEYYNGSATCGLCADKGCSKCFYSVERQDAMCTYCDTGLWAVKLTGKCVAKPSGETRNCSDGLVEYSSNCLPCPPGAKTCTTADGQTFKATVCFDGFTLSSDNCAPAPKTGNCSATQYSQGTGCFECAPSGCDACTWDTTLRQVKCLSCLSGGILSQSDGKCIKTSCGSGQFFDAGAMTCVGCNIKGCVKCNKDPSSGKVLCSDCAAGFTEKDDACELDACAAKTVLSKGLCMPCPPDCDVCEDDGLNADGSPKLTCKTCATNFTAKDGMCLKACD